MKTLLWIALASLVGLRADGCIWDSDTLSVERRKSPDIAKVILGETPPLDPAPLRARIKKLMADPHEKDAAWWNDLAGAYLRLGEAEKAASLLEPVMTSFGDDYGVHANLGTAYHLLGRYPEAEKEIARDLEINPDAHFGLEKYHLALLQYLIRDPKYQARHVYVDEFSASLAQARGPALWVEDSGIERSPSAAVAVTELEREYESLPVKDDYRADELLALLSESDEPPAYRAKWNLAEDTNFVRGVVYMATLNPKQPACFVMLGAASWRNRDLNLAVSAFEKAIALGSPQAELLKRKAQDLRGHIHKAQSMNHGVQRGAVFAGILLLGLAIAALLAMMRYFKYREARETR